jgi:23S rRNA (guanosine2251-2'-O)-methyltransferase
MRESDAFFAEHATGQTHGGVLALVGPRRYESLEALVAGKERPFIVMLDGIEDPFNFGQAVRALYAAGADGLVVRPRSWLTAVGTVTRAAAGATELLPTAVAETAPAAARVLRERGLQIACTTREKALSLYEADLTVGMFLLIGGEKRGITRSFLDEADLRLEIPYGRVYGASLGAAASTAVVAFEVLRQRGAGLPDAAEQPL